MSMKEWVSSQQNLLFETLNKATEMAAVEESVQEEEAQETETSADKTKWPSDAVNMLLNLRFSREKDFEDPQGRKIDIWNEISNDLKKVGYNYPGRLCFAKYRNLTSTYRRKKQMEERGIGSYSRWEHFELMDAHLANKEYKDTNAEIVEETYVEESELVEDGGSYYIIRQVEDVDMNEEQENVEAMNVEAHVVEMDENEKSDQNDSDFFQWTQAAVQLLLQLRLTKNYLWLKPSAKKVELWENVSKQMKENNFNVEGHACDMKYRNLLKTYKINKDKVERGLVTSCHWPHYEIFDTHLGYDSSALDSQKEFQNMVQEVLEEGDGNTQDEEQEDGGNKKGSVYHWLPAATKLMLTLRFQREVDFADPSKRKVQLWKEISKEMQRNGFKVPGYACDCKYRNLLATYRKVKEKVKDKGNTFVRWEYFDMMDFHLGHMTYTPYTPGKQRRGVCKEEPGTGEEEDEELFEDEEERPGSIRDRFRKRPRLSVSYYLHAKLKADERRRKECQIFESKKLRIEQKKLDLEVKKIDVLKGLLNAVKQLKKDNITSAVNNTVGAIG